MWNDQASPTLNTAFEPNPTYSWNSSGAHNTVTRTSVGIYQVRFPGDVDPPQSEPGTEVTAYGPGASYCVSSGTGLGLITVRCYNPDGSFADSRFTATYHHDSVNGALTWSHPVVAYDQSVMVARGRAVVVSECASTPVTTPFAAVRNGAGDYSVNLPSMSGTGRTSVNVTTIGTSDNNIGTATYCKVVNWLPYNDAEGIGTRVGVKCFNSAGTPNDSAMSIVFTSTIKPPC